MRRIIRPVSPCRFYCLILLVCALISPVFADPLRVGVYQNEPKIFLDESGRAAGILIDFLEEIARKEGWTLEYVPCEWSDCLDALTRGELDLLPDVAHTDERAANLSFHSNPALFSWLQVYCHPDLSLQSLLELNDRRVAVLKGSIQETAVRRIAEGFGFNTRIMPTATFDEAFEMVARNEADAVIVNHYFGRYHRARFGLKQTPIIFHPSQLYFATRKDQHPELLARIDEHIAKWRADPQSIYYTSLERWMGERPRTLIPRVVWWTLGAVTLLFALAALWSALLRHQVKLRTRELEQRNEHLRQVLGELEAAREKAVEQERLHILGQMASGIAHDFNNSLTLILGHAELLRMSIEDGTYRPAELLAELRVIEQAGADGSAIVRRMREFYRAREQSERTEPVQLDALARDVIELTRPRWGVQAGVAGHTFHIHHELKPVPPIPGMRHELREALLNLVLNALDAMPEGGHLTLRTRRGDGQVSIEVEDTGHGMSEEVQLNCTRPFFTTKAREGTGMGLSMVAGSVERHDGTLSIRSAEGEGSTFTLSFPVPKSPVQPTREGPAAQERPVRPLTILAVDNHARLLSTITSLLQTDGHRVYGALSAADALLLVRTHTFDMAFVDLAMPDMNGAQLIQALRAKGLTLPIIVVTGTVQGLDAASVGAHSVLSKPLTLPQLRRVLLELGFGN